MFKTVCNSCGKETESPVNSIGDPYNPKGWYSRLHEGKTQHACCRECCDKLGGLVAPW